MACTWGSFGYFHFVIIVKELPIRPKVEDVIFSLGRTERGLLPLSFYFLTNDMFIIINGKPLNIFSIDTVTDVIGLVKGRYGFCVNTILDQTYSNYKKNIYESNSLKYKPITKNILNYMEGIQNIKSDDGIHLRNHDSLTPVGLDEDGNYGYYFVIWTTRESPEDKFICSTIYKTKEEAEEALRHLLATINEITYSLPNIKI